MKNFWLILFALPLFAQDIDWINKTMTVKGSAYGNNMLMAKRGAKTDARRNMVEAIKEIRIDSKTIVRDLEVEQDLVISESSGFIRRAFFDKNSSQCESEGDRYICTTVLTMPLVGEYSRFIFPKNETEFSSEKKENNNEGPGAIAKQYSGLVIDLRGRKITPSMAPKIVTKYGVILYGMSNTSRKYATKMGVVGYINDTANPSSITRVGSNPLIVKAVNISGDIDFPTDAIVDSQSADAISTLSQNILAQCKVAFLID